MVYGYDNLNIDADRIEDLYPDGYYNHEKIERIFIQPKYRRNKNGRIIPPTMEEDVELNMIRCLKPGDTVITTTLTNFSQTGEGVMLSLQELKEAGARVISFKEDFDSEKLDPYTLKVLIDVFRQVRRVRRRSQRVGIEAAKKAGRYSNVITTSNFPEFDQYYKRYLNHDLTKVEFAKQLGISRPTLDKLIKEQQAIEERRDTYR